MNSNNRTENLRSNPTPETTRAEPEGTIPFDRGLRTRDWGGILVTLIAVMIVLFTGTPTFLGNEPPNDNPCEDCCDDDDENPPKEGEVCCEKPDGETTATPVEDCCNEKIPDEGEECCNDEVIDLETHGCCEELDGEGQVISEEKFDREFAECCLGEVVPFYSEPLPQITIELDNHDFQRDDLILIDGELRRAGHFAEAPIFVQCSSGRIFPGGYFEAWMEIVKFDHYIWGGRNEDYDDEHGTPRTNLEERFLAIQHEFDHHQTMEAASEAVGMLNGLSGTCCDEEYAQCLQDWWDSVWAAAVVHTKSFDNDPDRRSPIKYDTYPFEIPELDCEPPE